MGESERRVHVSLPGGEPELLAELAATFPDASHELFAPCLIASVLSAADAARVPSLAFARQVLPAAAEVRAASVNGFAQLLVERLRTALEGHEGPWRLHVFAPHPSGALRPGRSRLVAEAVDELLGRKLRRLRRTLVREPGEGRLGPAEALVQLALVTPEEALLSVSTPDVLATQRRVVSQFAGGAVELARDPRPPSRAYGKLLEAEQRLGRRIRSGERCVDLGASPGGWTFVAVDRGAHVTAVDRSPLRDDLMRSPLVEFVKGDAFAWVPEAPVDWLLCDLIAFPERSLALLEHWLARGLCRRFVVTVKFRGDADQQRLAELKALLEASGADFAVRRLDVNKNEVTALGAARGVAG